MNQIVLTGLILFPGIAASGIQGAGDCQDKKPKRTLESFKKALDKTMTPDKAIKAFGEPDRKLGSGLIIYEYDLADGTFVRLGFPGFDRILYARHVKKGDDAKEIPLK